MNHPRILLCSGSPRRRQLLEQMDLPFEVVKAPDVDEVYDELLPSAEVPVYLSKLKAGSYANLLKDNELLITADTVVILDGEIIGKPADLADAERMIAKLAGNTHTVVTGVTLTLRRDNQTIEDSFSETTEVFFAPLTPEEIHEYVTRYKPLDKAGAYGVQEWIGLTCVNGLRGCFYNVMGLPTPTLYRHLKQLLGSVPQVSR